MAVSSPPHDTKTGLPRWAKALIVVGILALLAVGTVLMLNQASANRWQRYAASIRAAGEPLTLEEIEARRTQIPEERNGARVLERLGAQLGGVGGNGWSVDRAVLMFGRKPASIDFFAGVPRYRVGPSRDFVKAHREALGALEALRDMPTGRLELPLDANPSDIVFPSLSHVRTAGKLVYLDGALKLVDGDLSGAAEAVVLIAHIGGTLDEHPTVIGRLVQIAVEAQVPRAIENVFRVGEVEQERVQQLADVVESRLASSTMRWAFLGERAFFVRVCDALVNGDLSLADITEGSDSGGPGWLPQMLIRPNQMRGVEMLTWLVDAAGDPAAMTKATARISREAPALSKSYFLVTMLLPDLSRSVELHLRVQAELHCTAAALAAERFRIVTGRLPTSLSELVPEYLDAVPADPFGGQPMRFATTEKGIVIYSVGENLTDDGGDVAYREKRPHHPDAGLRLFRPEHRGLVLTDEPPASDD